MIAQPLILEDESPSPRSRAARGAAQRRRARTKRLRYVMAARITAIVGVLTIVVVAYLSLVGNVERMNFELSVAEGDRAKLVEQSEKLDDTLARLRSRDRLAAIAAKLGMHESSTFVSVALPNDRVQPPPSGLALLAHLR